MFGAFNDAFRFSRIANCSPVACLTAGRFRAEFRSNCGAVRLYIDLIGSPTPGAASLVAKGCDKIANTAAVAAAAAANFSFRPPRLLLKILFIFPPLLLLIFFLETFLKGRGI